MNTHARDGHASWRALGRTAGLGAVIGIVIALALGLATYAAAASYKSVSNLAERLNIPLAWLCPVGIDGGLLAIIIFDIALTILGKPIRWLRMVARLFAMGVIAANVAAGWPDPIGIGLRLAAPLLIVVIVEAARTVLLHRHDDPFADRIPRVRWVLDFKGTVALWRRMRLWGETSYSRAVEIELERIAAIEKLAMRYAPDDWADYAPADLVWMLQAGVRMPEALKRVGGLTVSEPGAEGSGDRKPLRRAAGSANGTSGRKLKPATAADPGDEDTDELSVEALVLSYLDQGKSASEAGRLAGVSDSRGRQIARDLAKKAPEGVDSEASS